MYRIESNHMLGKVHWQSTCHDRSVVRNLQQTISDFTNNEFRELIEGWIVSINPNSQNFSVPQVVIELGKLPSHNLKFHLIERTKQALSRISISQIKGVIEKPSKHDFETRLRNLTFSIETGINTNQKRQNGDPQLLMEFLELLRLNRRQTIGLILSNASGKLRTNILFHNASKDAVELSLQLVSPLYGSKVVSLISKLTRYLGLILYSNRNIQELTLMFYEVSLKYLLKAAFNGFEISAWLNLMLNILQIKDSKFNHQLELCEYLGLDANLLSEGATHSKLIYESEAGKLEEKNHGKISVDGKQIYLRIEKCMTFLEAGGVDPEAFPQLVSDLDLLANLDLEAFNYQLSKQLKLISHKVRSGGKFPTDLIEQHLQLFFDNDYHILKKELQLLVKTIFTDNSVAVLDSLLLHTVKIISEKKQGHYDILNLINELVCYLSKTYSIKPFSIFEKVNSSAILSENRYFILHDNRLWQKFVRSPFEAKRSSLKHLKLSELNNNYLDDSVNQGQRLFPGNEKPQDFNYGIVKNIRELLQFDHIDNEAVAMLFRYFSLNPNLASNLFFQHYNRSSFYDPVNITFPEFWISILEKLFSRCGTEISGFLRELLKYSYQDSHIKFMFPYAARKLFLIAYNNPGLAASEILAQMITCLNKSHLLPLEQKFIDVAKFILMPDSYSEIEKCMRVYKLVSDQPVCKLNIKEILFTVEHTSLGYGELTNLIKLLRRFYNAELLQLGSTDQKELVWRLTGEKICIDDLLKFLLDKNVIDYNISGQVRFNLATELFWDTITCSQITTGKIGFYEQALFVYKSGQALNIHCNSGRHSYDKNSDETIEEKSIISLQDGTNILKSETTLLSYEESESSHKHLSEDFLPIYHDVQYSIEDEFNDFKGLVSRKNWQEVSAFSNSSSLDKMALMLEVSLFHEHHEFCNDIRGMKAFIRELPNALIVNEKKIILNLVMGLDSTDIADSWKSALSKIYKLITDEIDSFEERTLINLRNYDSVTLLVTKQDIASSLSKTMNEIHSNHEEKSFDGDRNEYAMILNSLKPVDCIQIVRYILEWNRLPLWISSNLHCPAAEVIEIIFHSKPDYIRGALQTTQGESALYTRLLSYMTNSSLITFLVHEKFICQTEGKEFNIVHNRLMEDQLDVQNSVGTLLIHYWVQSKCKRIIKGDFYNSLLLSNYRRSLKTIQQYRHHFAKYIQHYPVDFQLAFNKIFPLGNQSGIQRRISQVTANTKSINEVLEHGLRIYNGGIVLINSYLRELFYRLNLLEGNQFKNPGHRQKAILALHYFVSGSEVIESQQDIVINKVLCGFAIDEIFETVESLSKDDKEIIDGLISAMISHWNAIKTSSLDGFRGNWLIRDGTLSRHQQKLNLTVEKKVYDMLLNQSPFSFSVIQFPWMAETLYVKWQTI